MGYLGDTLREARERRGLSLEDAESTTRIRQKYLAALESEDYDAFPAQTYIKGFLRNYASYLGLDVPSVLVHFPGEGEPDVLEPIPQISRRSSRLATWVVAVAVVIVVGITGIYLYQERRVSGSDAGRLVIEVPPTATPTLLPTYTPRADATPKAALSLTPIRPTPVVTASGPAQPAVTSTATVVSTPVTSPTVVATTPSPTVVATFTPTRTPVSNPTAVAVAVPPVGGLTYDQAERTITRAGFSTYRQDEVNQSVPANVVFAQNPAPGQMLTPGSSVTLLVSKGPTALVVPDVKGKKEEEAKQILASAGLRVDTVIFYDGSQAASWTCNGCVTSTTPDPGAPVDPGTVIKLAVRKNW